MATTSSNLTASTASSGRNGNGKGSKGRVAGLVATAALGLTLLVGLTFSQGHQGAQPANAPASTNPSVSATGILPGRFTDREDHRTVATAIDPRSWSSQAAGTDDLATSRCVGTAGPFACQSGQSLAGTDDLALIGCVQAPGPFACQASVADQFAYREDRRALGNVPQQGVIMGETPCPLGGTAPCGISGLYGVTPAPAPGLPNPTPRVYAGQCQPGGSDCVPDEEIQPGVAAQDVRPTDASITGDYRWDFGAGQSPSRPVDASTSAEYHWDFPAVTATAFVPNQLTFREDHRASANAGVTSFLPGGARFQYVA